MDANVTAGSLGSPATQECYVQTTLAGQKWRRNNSHLPQAQARVGERRAKPRSQDLHPSSHIQLKGRKLCALFSFPFLGVDPPTPRHPHPTPSTRSPQATSYTICLVGSYERNSPNKSNTSRRLHAKVPSCHGHTNKPRAEFRMAKNGDVPQLHKKEQATFCV